MKRIFSRIVIIVPLFILFSCNREINEVPKFSDENNKKSFDIKHTTKKLITAENSKINSLMVIYKDSIIAEYYSDGYDQNTIQNIYTGTILFTNTLIGIAENKGLLNRFDRLNYFLNDTSVKHDIKIKHLLSMSSGIKSNDNYQLFSSKSSEYRLSTIFEEIPGKSLKLKSEDADYLIKVLREVTNDSLDKFINEELFDKIGINNFKWSMNSENLIYGSYGLYLTMRDYAKLGLLYANKGQWEGEQVLSKDWVEASMTDFYPDNEINYGYGFFLTKRGGAYIYSIGCQYLFVYPDYDLVIVILGDVTENYSFSSNVVQYVGDILNSLDSESSDLLKSSNKETIFDNDSLEISKEFKIVEIPRAFFNLVGQEIEFSNQDINVIHIPSTHFDKKIDFTEKNVIINSLIIEEIDNDSMKMRIILNKDGQKLSEEISIGLDGSFKFNNMENDFFSEILLDYYPNFNFNELERCKYGFKGTVGDYFRTNFPNEKILRIECKPIGSSVPFNMVLISSKENIYLILDFAEIQYFILAK